MRPVVSLYCLDNDDDYLGSCEAEQSGLTWLGFESVTAGTLFLSAKRLLFQPHRGSSPSPSILTFQLTDISDMVVATQPTPWSIAFQSTCHTEAITRLDSTLIGPWNPVQRTSSWRFRFSSASEDWRLSLETLATGGGVERRLQLQERKLQSLHADCTSFPVRRVLPLREQRGLLVICPDQIRFEPLFPLGTHQACVVPCSAVRFMFPRWVLFEDTGLEFHHVPEDALNTPRELACSSPLLSVVFFTPAEKREAIRALQRVCGTQLLTIPIAAVTRSWQLRELSNYEYLLSLNLLASRSRLDLHQYPVFPWVLQDYSANVDIQHPSAYRDLSKPIGALQPPRLEQLRARAEVLVDMGQPFCLYTSHYSSAWAVSYYLVRPHPEYQFCLQSGRLDNADRLFESVAATWANVNRGSSDFKELTPEFFSSEFLSLAAPLTPSTHLSLGVKQDGSDVAPALRLPESAATAASFLQLHCAALESEYVSSTIHLWIDLIFGVKQDGEDALLAANVFHPYCYPQPIDGSSVGGGSAGMSGRTGGAGGAAPVTGGSNAANTRAYAREFGNVPMKLFTSLHPGRNSYTSETRQTSYARSVTQSLHAAAPSLSVYQDADEPSPVGSSHALVPPLPTVLVDDDSADSDDSAAGLMAGEVSLTSVPVVCTLTETSRLTVGCDSPHTLLLSVFTKDDGCGGSEQRATLTVLESECQSVFLYDCFSGDRLRCFSDFETPVERIAGYHELVFIFTQGGAVYVVDASICTIVGHVMAVCGGSPIRDASFTLTHVALVDAESCVSVWCVHDGGSVEASLSAKPALHVEAPAAVTSLSLREERPNSSNSGEVRLALCTATSELVQCSGPGGEVYSSHQIPMPGSVAAMVFSSEGRIILCLPTAILTMDPEDGAVLHQILFPPSVMHGGATSVPLLYDGADFILVLDGDTDDKKSVDGGRPCRTVLVRDGFISGAVDVPQHALSPVALNVTSAEYFVLCQNSRSGEVVLYAVDSV